MLERLVSYMDSAQRPVSIHHIAKAINAPEIDVLEVLNKMVKKGISRIVCVPLSPENENSTYYVLTKMNIEN